MADRPTTVQALNDCFDALDALCGDLSADDWQVQSLCPEWTVHGVVAHLAGIEHMLAEWMPSGPDDPPPFGKVGEFAKEAAGLSGPELHERLRPILAARRAQLETLTDEQFDQPSLTPVGPQTYGRFLQIRVFDFWVHQRDITWPLGRDTDDSGAAAAIALDEVHGSLGYIVGKKVGLPDGKAITFHLTGPVPRDLHARVDGRAAVVDSLDDPDVVVTADTPAFVMLACGRVDPQEMIDAGRITWTGDDEWGQQAARNLRFTM